MAHDFDDDSEEIEEEEEEEEEEEFNAEEVERIESAYRSDRRVIQTCTSIDKLEELKRGYQKALSRNILSVARIRFHDLLELLILRLAELKAREP